MEALVILLLLVVLGYIFRTHQLAGKVDQLERRLDDLISAAPRVRVPAPPPSTQAQPVRAPDIIAQPQPVPFVVPREPRPAAPAAAAQPAPVGQPTAAPQPAPRPLAPEAPHVTGRTREEWELLVGGKLLNRIGALALVLGVGFFFKYAFDNNWITETMRVVIGLLAGAGLIAGGERARSKDLPIFAHGLVGAGLAILYLSIYAAFNFYQLVAQPVALAAMSLVTVLAFVQALRYNAQSIGLLGWAGGFLTPFLLASDQASAFGLFAYVLLLDLGLLAVVWWRDSWVLLELLTRGATYVVFGLWYVSSYTQAEFDLAVLFVAIFWSLFFALHLAQVFRKETTLMALRHVGAAVNTLVWYGSLYSLVNGRYPGWIAGVTLAIGAIYVATALVIMRRRPDQTIVHALYTLIAMAALVLATGLQYSGFTLVVGWSLEALALLWCAQRWKLDYVRYSALGLYLLALLRLVGIPGALAYTPIAAFTPLLNERALSFGVLILALAASTWFFRDWTRQRDKDLSLILHSVWSVMLLGLLTLETNDTFRLLIADAARDQVVYLRYLRPLTIAMLWIAFSLPLVWGAIKTNTPSLLVVGSGAALIAAGIVALFGLSFEPITGFRLILNVRFAAFVLVIGGLWLHARWLGYRPAVYMPRLWYILSALLIFELITVETRDSFGRAMLAAVAENDMSGLNRLNNLQRLAISSVWLVYASVLIGLGFWRRVPALRIGAILLAGITILKIVVYDLAFLETLYRIFSFIGLGLILLGVSYLYQRYKAVIFGTPSSHQSRQHS